MKSREYIFIVLVSFLKLAHCQRRIENGVETQAEKKYVVYLVKAASSPVQYDGWMCGGAIVSTTLIVTSAACVEDVQHMYAIAGYKKYVPAKKIDEDTCTKTTKKKVVFICMPRGYKLDYNNIERWSLVDIAVVKVESPYDFNAVEYTTHCSYAPSTININYDPKYQEPGVDALVFGWGHLEKWRDREDLKDYNSEMLRDAPVALLSKEECKKHYTDYPGLQSTIDRFMICTMANGNIDSNGNQIPRQPGDAFPLAEGCGPGKYLRQGYCVDEYDLSRKSNGSEAANETFLTPSRRNGICQNDHGGPLVTFVGFNEVLIGVASVFRVGNDSRCKGPYLYTSTQCTGAFLDCVMNSELNGRRSAICDQFPKERGFDIVERQISWKNHPAGPSDNERYGIRPQIPLKSFG